MRGAFETTTDINSKIPIPARLPACARTAEETAALDERAKDQKQCNMCWIPIASRLGKDRVSELLRINTTVAS